MPAPLWLLSTLIIGCSEPADTGDPATPPGEAETEGSGAISVPGAIDFGSVAVGDQATEVLTLENPGDGDLHLQDLLLAEGAEGFTVGALTTILVPPGGASEVVITFAPERVGDASTWLTVDSDATASPSAEIELLAAGTGPSLEVSPTSEVEGQLYAECSADGLMSLRNAGTEDLYVYDLDGAGLLVDPLEVDNGPLPWTIAPGDEREFSAAWDPLGDQASATLTVSSNDPAAAERSVIWTEASGQPGARQESFRQTDAPPVDILFAVDGTASSHGYTADLSVAFDSFIETLDALGVDYQIGLVMADDGCFNGSYDYIEPSMDASLQQQIFDEMLAGSYGTYHEAQLQLMTNALNKVGPGDCNEGFYREEAKIVFISVAVEPEGSPNDYNYYVSMFQSLKDSAFDVVIHAIAGDYPAGCGGNPPGVGHYEATVATGGEYLSICELDYTANMETLAAASTANNRYFELSLPPIEDTITVSVDGVALAGWSYVEDGNYVLFEDGAQPAAGAEVLIDYYTEADCP